MDCFVGKYDSNGNLIWARSVGSAGNADLAFDVAADANGNVYLVGQFDQTANFDPGVSDFSVTSNGLRDAFICKYNANGDFQWAKTIGGTDLDAITAVAVNDNGNVVVLGQYQNTVDLDPGPGTLISTSNGGDDIFISTFDPQGDLVWSKQMGSSGFDGAADLATDVDGNIVIGGLTYDSLDVDPSATGTYNLGINADMAGFVVKLDGNGDFVFAKEYRSDSYCEVVGVTCDTVGNAYTLGAISGATNLDVGVSDTTITSSGDGTFITKTDSLGNLVWVKGFPAIDGHYPYNIAVDGLQRVYTVGGFFGVQDFDPDAGVSNMDSGNNYEAYLLKLDSDGSYLWSEKFTGPNSEGADICIGPDYAIISTGYFSNTADFDPFTGPVELTSQGGNDIYIHKISQCVPQLYTDTVVSCELYQWVDAVTYTNDTLTSYLILTDSFGCDSLVRLNLDILDAPNNTVTVNGATIEAVATGVTYQWIDCATLQPINGEQGQTFTASAPGEYAVIVSGGNCSDTSDCTLLADAGIISVLEHQVLLYPNPNNTASFTIATDLNVSEVQVLDIYGRNIPAVMTGLTVNISGLATGRYFVYVQTESGVVRKELVIVR